MLVWSTVKHHAEMIGEWVNIYEETEEAPRLIARVRADRVELVRAIEHKIRLMEAANNGQGHL